MSDPILSIVREANALHEAGRMGKPFFKAYNGRSTVRVSAPVPAGNLAEVTARLREAAEPMELTVCCTATGSPHRTWIEFQ